MEINVMIIIARIKLVAAVIVAAAPMNVGDVV